MAQEGRGGGAVCVVGLPQDPGLGVWCGGGHVVDHHSGELRALHLLALAQREQPLEVVGHCAFLDRSLHPIADQVSGLQITQGNPDTRIPKPI